MLAIGKKEKKMIAYAVAVFATVDLVGNILPVAFWSTMFAFFLKLILFIVVIQQHKIRDMFFLKGNIYYSYYYVYVSIIIIMGLILSSSYEKYSYVINVFLPILFLSTYVYLCSKIGTNVLIFFKSIIIVMLPLSMIKYFGDFSVSMTNFSGYVSFIYIFIFLIPYLSIRFKLSIIMLFLMSFFYELNDRTNVIILICCSLILLLGNYFFHLSIGIKKTIHLVLFILPLLFLFLAYKNVFNVFDLVEKIEVSSSEEKIGNTDSRTFLYYEVLKDQRELVDVIFGKSACGTYYSEHFSSFYEHRNFRRISTECGVLNYYLKGGVILVLLYGSMLFIASWRIIKNARNIFSSNIGLFIILFWIMSFVELPPGFNNWYVILFIGIGITYNSELYSLSDIKLKRLIKCYRL